MLVLTRRPEEKIVFPGLGISISVLRVRGNIIKIGVEAPREITVLRGEAVDAANPQLWTPSEAVAPAIPAATSVSTPVVGRVAAVGHTQELSSHPADLAELAARMEQSLVGTDKDFRHAFRNRLNALTLSLSLYRRQLEGGFRVAADQTLQNILAQCETLESDLNRALGGRPMAPAPIPAASPKAPGQWPTLIVEDDRQEAELLSSYLRLHDFEVVAVNDGRRALELLDQSPAEPEFLLLDMKLPNCDGTEVIQRIRQNPRFDRLKILAMSGSDPQDLGFHGLPAGVMAWFSKPLNPENLVSQMRTLAG